MTSAKKRLISIMLCTVCAISLMPTVAAFANNHADSPYTYKIAANGTVYTNDHRAKTDDSFVYVKPETTGYYVTPVAWYSGGWAEADGDRIYMGAANREYFISNYIYEYGFRYAGLKFDSRVSTRAQGLWSPDSV